MRFQKEINIFAKDAILKRFQTNETNFSVVKGKIEALISESEILELQNSKVTMYSKLVDVKLTVDGLEQTYTDITSKYDAVAESTQTSMPKLLSINQVWMACRKTFHRCRQIYGTTIVPQPQ